ncbi:MAG: efflux RND transporter permease subunit, partial [Prevotella sp.]|nr:efflux RND transporter permease subunit [Prevotella sp.]
MTFTNFIKRPVLSTVISILIVILGFIGLFSLPIEQYPDIAPPTVVVHTSYPGADAETVKNSVLAPLEESINGVEGMDYISSSASSGSASMTIMFRQGMNPDMCAVNVQNRVQQALALLPAEVTRIGVTVMKRQTSQVMMFTLTSDGRYDDQFLTNYSNINIIPAIKRIQGVGDVQSPGLKTYAMRIWLKPEVLKQYNLMPSDISNLLAEQNIEAAPGNFGQESEVAFEYSMRYTGRLKSAEEFGDIVITSDSEGNTLKLKDVADIELGGQQYTVSMKNNNVPSVMGMVQQIAGSNANEIAKQVKKELEEQQKLMPPGMFYKINYDVTEFLYASIEEVVFTLLMTLILVFLVVYIFLQDMR